MSGANAVDHMMTFSGRTKPATSEVASLPVSAVSIPAKYQELIFNKREDQFPSHHLYYCPNILPGAQILFCQICFLWAWTQDFQRVPHKESAKRVYSPTTWPAGVPIFMCDPEGWIFVPLRGLWSAEENDHPSLKQLLNQRKWVRHQSAKLLTKLDLWGAYNLFCIHEGNERKTAFWSQSGHSEYLAMHFRLSNELEIFQHILNDVFKNILDLFIVVYLDNIFALASMNNMFEWYWSNWGAMVYTPK